MNQIQIQGSELKDLRIAILDPDVQRAALHEAALDHDVLLRRARIYVVSDVLDLVQAVAKYSIDLAIFPESGMNKDVVYIQTEIHSIAPAARCLILINDLALTTMREALSVGNLYDLAEVGTLQFSSHLAALILNFARDRSNISGLLPIMSQLQSALTIGSNEVWRGIKPVSAKLLSHMVGAFDISLRETAYLEHAERLYFPWIETQDYQLIVPDGLGNAATTLMASGSWTSNRQPTSAAGMLVTLANDLAYRLNRGDDKGTMVSDVLTRPVWLRHPSIRGFSQSELQRILAKVASLSDGGDLRESA